MLNKIESKLDKYLEEKGKTLYKIDLVEREDNLFLEILINKVTLKDIETMAPEIDLLVENSFKTEKNYYLDIASSGIRRKLENIKQEEQAIDEDVKVILLNKETYKGKLKSVNDKTIFVDDKEFIKSEIKFIQVEDK